MLVVLVVAAVSVCVAMITNQNSGRLYDNAAVVQKMQAEQMRWLAEGLCHFQTVSQSGNVGLNPGGLAWWSGTAWSPGQLGFTSECALGQGQYWISLSTNGDADSRSGSCSPSGRADLSQLGTVGSIASGYVQRAGILFGGTWALPYTMNGNTVSNRGSYTRY